MSRGAGLAAAMLLLSPLQAKAWGPEGHEIIAHIAARALTPRARVEVGRLLGGEAEAVMATDANWADEIRDARPDTARWHFVDIPLGAVGFDRARDCSQADCLVGQIEKDRAILADHGRPAAARAEALKFLLHFVGDVHQPLHAIDNNDHGGNAIKIWVERKSSSMHHYWDTMLVETLGDDAGEVAAQIEAHTPAQQRTAWQSGTPVDWANESFRLAGRDIYGRLRSGGPQERLELPRDYQASEAPVLRAQLAKAGLRLAWLLNAIFR